MGARAGFWYLYHLPPHFLVTGKFTAITLSFPSRIFSQRFKLSNPPKTYCPEMASLNSLVIKKSVLSALALAFFIIALVFLIYMSVSLIFSIRCLNLSELGYKI